MSFATPLINAVGETVYIQTRALGARNAVTNQPATTFGSFDPDDFNCADFNCAVKTKIIMNLNQVSEQDLDAGRLSVERQQGFLPGNITVNHLDRVEYHSLLYEVESREVIEWHLAESGFQRVNLVRISE
jgi:hypothetical protein